MPENFDVIVILPIYGQFVEQIGSRQGRIQRFKEVSQTDYVPGFPLAAAWISRSTSIMICVELSTLTHWSGAYQCKISWRLHLSVKTQYLKYWLNQFCKTSINFQPAMQGLFSLIPKAVAHMNFALNFVGFFRTPFLYNIHN